jgi:ketosteroid isomerase-like protein
MKFFGGGVTMELHQTLIGYIRATNSHDFKNVRRFLSEDAVYWFQKNEYNTIAEIEKYFTNTWNLIKDEVYRISDVKWIGESSDLATCLYKYHWEGYYKGDFINGSGNATNVFKRINGDWKLIHEHLSSLS